MLQCTDSPYPSDFTFRVMAVSCGAAMQLHCSNKTFTCVAPTELHSYIVYAAPLLQHGDVGVFEKSR